MEFGGGRGCASENAFSPTDITGGLDRYFGHWNLLKIKILPLPVGWIGPMP